MQHQVHYISLQPVRRLAELPGSGREDARCAGQARKHGIGKWPDEVSDAGLHGHGLQRLGTQAAQQESWRAPVRDAADREFWNSVAFAVAVEIVAPDLQAVTLG